jgi:hypothetical protein
VPCGVSPYLKYFGGHIPYSFAQSGVWKAPFGEILHLFVFVT